MDIKRDIARLIARVGNTIYPSGQEDKGWKAIISPLQYRNKLYVEETSVPAGMIDRGAYFYIGLPENDLTVYPRGTLFVSGGVLLTLTHCETTFMGDRPKYVWAVFNLYGREGDSL